MFKRSPLALNEQNANYKQNNLFEAKDSVSAELMNEWGKSKASE